MLALPVSRYLLSIAKFCVLAFYLLMDDGRVPCGVRSCRDSCHKDNGCDGNFACPLSGEMVRRAVLTMLPCVGTMWAITVLFEKPLLSVGLNLLLVIPGVLVANTPLWIAYPYCYSGYLVSCSLHDFTVESNTMAFSLFPFLPVAVLVFVLVFAVAVIKFGKKEMR